MIIIADSGSTKTQWCLTGKNRETSFVTTSGINPFFRSGQDIEKELRQEIPAGWKSAATRIVFYGAGIINAEKAKVVKNALSHVFCNAEMEVFSDLLAAAHATLGNSPGIACILGTGSNSCYYDGEKIAAHIPPLGFILGDEGSGAVLGRKLLADYLKGLLPAHLSEKFKLQFPYSYTELLEKVYRQEKPNRFLAGFAPFLSENIHEKYCINLVENAFQEFINRNIGRYPGADETRVCFVGSVAWHFREQLQKVMQNNRLQTGTILKEPMDGLIKFYTQENI